MRSSRIEGASEALQMQGFHFLAFRLLASMLTIICNFSFLFTVVLPTFIVAAELILLINHVSKIVFFASFFGPLLIDC